jgi:hypothetical protein
MERIMRTPLTLIARSKLEASNAASSIADPRIRRNKQVEFQSRRKSPLPADRIQKQQQCGAQAAASVGSKDHAPKLWIVPLGVV